MLDRNIAWSDCVLGFIIVASLLQDGFKWHKKGGGCKQSMRSCLSEVVVGMKMKAEI